MDRKHIRHLCCGCDRDFLWLTNFCMKESAALKSLETRNAMSNRTFKTHPTQPTIGMALNQCRLDAVILYALDAKLMLIVFSGNKISCYLKLQNAKRSMGAWIEE